MRKRATAAPGTGAGPEPPDRERFRSNRSSGTTAGDEGAGGPSPWLPVARSVLGVLVFLAAIRLMGEATGAAADDVARILAALEGDPLPALGLGWLATYLLTNGSVVAALGVALAGSGAGDAELTLALVSGSRLGAAAFVVLVGIMDHVRRRDSFRSSLELGLLTFVVSHALYIPATLVTWGALPFLGPPLARLTSRLDPAFLRPGVVDAAAHQVVTALGPLPAAAAGVVGLFLGVVLFDRALRSANLERFRRWRSFGRRWPAFAAGLLVTGLTSSIAFSVGVLVPIFNRSDIGRKEIIPYLLGANVTTLADTFVVSLVLESWDGGGAVLALMLTAFVLATLYLVAYRSTARLLVGVLDAVTATRTAFFLVLASLAVAPALLVLLGSWS